MRGLSNVRSQVEEGVKALERAEN